jgi:hypothetical protein
MGSLLVGRRMWRRSRTLRAMDKVGILELHGRSPPTRHRNFLENLGQRISLEDWKVSALLTLPRIPPSIEAGPPLITCSTSGSVRASFSS